MEFKNQSPDPLPGLLQELKETPRTTCGCALCTAACQTSPGCLAPGDMSAILQHVNPRDGFRFMEEHFVASEGAMVLRRGDTEPTRIGTITPAQQEDGRCVFLDAENKCTIHPVAPFGCRVFNVCDGPAAVPEDRRRVALYLQAIQASAGYAYLRERLRGLGRIARPLTERKAAMHQRVAELEAAQQTETTAAH